MHFFQVPFAEMKTRSNIALQQFHTYYAPLVSKSIKKALDMGPNFCPINSYFQPSISTHPEPTPNNNDISNNAPIKSP